MGKNYCAIDLGASHGRAVIGRIEKNKLTLDPIHDFANSPIHLLGSRHWDPFYIFREIQTALKKTSHSYGPDIDGIGVDSWGIDFSLFDCNYEMLGMPYSYRDTRTNPLYEEILNKIDRFSFFEMTGVRLLPMQEICQLYAMRRQNSKLLCAAEYILNMAEMFSFWLSGRPVSEHTMAGGCGWYDISTGGLAEKLFELFSIPKDIFPEIVQPGTVLGQLLPEIQKKTGLGPVPVVIPAAHDTANVTAAIPSEPDSNRAFLNSGTWGIIGTVSHQPMITREAFETGITNFPTYNRMYMNVCMFTNLWLIQECRKCWRERGHDLAYEDITQLAIESEPMTAFVDPDDQCFSAPLDMEDTVKRFCTETGQQVPAGIGPTARVVFESLALKCRDLLRNIQTVHNTTFQVLHILGGGAVNMFLNQLIADAADIRVMAGPAEATAVGNIMIQAIETDSLDSPAAARETVRNSFEITAFMPKHTDVWSEATFPSR